MIQQLNVHCLRNLNHISIHPSRCNLIVGNNGSGKTSLLEAVYLLSRGKSFRHYQPKRYITHQQPSVTVFAKLDNDSSIGIQKSADAATIMRIDGQSVYQQSLLTRRLPTLLIDPTSMDILEVGSSNRRQLLDWIVFHVKPEFYVQWLAYQRLLKQRNSLLRNTLKLSHSQRQELAAWDKGLASHAALITHYRKQVFDTWLPVFDSLLNQLLPASAPFIQLKFSPGYDTSYHLDELLIDRVDQDCHMGYTRIGCHRADIQILWREEHDVESNAQSSRATTTIKDQAVNILSRGEKKLLITALKLSQLPLLYNDKDFNSTINNSSINSSTTHNDRKDTLEDATNIRQQKKQENLSQQITENDINSPNVTVKKASAGNDVQHKFNAILTPPIVLLDDIAAELDTKALDLLLKSLARIPCQIFLTNLDCAIQSKLTAYWQSFTLFHMKHGEIVQTSHVEA